MSEQGIGMEIQLDKNADTILRLDKIIDRGQQGTIYKAWDIKRKRYVALKLLTPGYCTGESNTPEALKEAQDQFYRKCQTLAQATALPPELILPETVGPMMPDGAFCYTMPLLEGYHPVSRAISLQHRDELTPKQRLELCRKIAQIILALHKARMIFCDISETNIQYRIDPAGNVLVRLIDCENITRIGHTLGLQGTGLYRAPELLIPDPLDPEGKLGKPSYQSDIFSVAVLTFRILCFGHPLGGKQARKQMLTPELVAQHYGTHPRFVLDPRCITASSRTIQLWSNLPQGLKAYYTCIFSPDSLFRKSPRIPLNGFIQVINNYITY